jgi:ferrous iron transport protein B
MSSHVPVIALAGSPNAGKSVLFNRMTGLTQKVANYPGVTVEKKLGHAVDKTGRKYLVMDLPGTYSLDPVSLDEQVAINTILGLENHVKPDGLVVVLDATNLERTLSLVLELKPLKLPMIVALNMMDLAEKRGLKLNKNILSQKLGCAVVSLVAVTGSGLDMLYEELGRLIEKRGDKSTSENAEALVIKNHDSSDAIAARYQEVDAILNASVESPTEMDRFSWRLDRVLLHPVWGTLVLLTTLFMLFQAVYAWAQPFADGIDGAFISLQEILHTNLPEHFLVDLLADGVVAGVGAVLVFLPQILLLFFLISLLEASGYMMRAAFLLDKLMRFVGLQGRSFVPLLSSFACAIPGIMAARTIRSDRDRLVTILVAPLMPCSARLPVYALLIGAFIPAVTVGGIFNMQGLAMFGLFLVGVGTAFAVSLIVKIFGRSQQQTPFLLELPTYKTPNMRYIATSLWLRTKAFLMRAGTTILGLSIALWFLASYPKPPADATEPAINYSFAGQMGYALEPLVKPIGFDWRIATGLIPGFAAREVMVSALATVFAIEAENDDAVQRSLGEKLRSTWPLATGLSLLAWYVFAPQCMATLATVRRETGGWKWAGVMLVYMLALAYGAAWLTYKIFA